MSRTRVRIDPGDPRSLPSGRVDHAVLDATTEEDIAQHARDDDAEAMQDMARFARRVRRRLGLTQVEFARRIDVPHETQPGPCSGFSTRRPRRRSARSTDSGSQARHLPSTLQTGA